MFGSSGTFGTTLAVVVALAGPANVSSGFPADTEPCLVAPVSTPVVSVFEPPVCEYCAGRRSIDFAPAVGEPVVAPIGGRVSFAGTVARTRYVSITAGSPTRSPMRAPVRTRWVVTVGRLETLTVTSGEWVGPGRTIGRAGAAPVSLSWRRDGRYADPTPVLGRLVGRARLVPTDGTPPRRADRAGCRRSR